MVTKKFNVVMWMHFIVFTATLTSAVAQQIFYVLPDDRSNDTCYSLQPCDTLTQYLLDNNGSLPVVTNVEYRFFPGEHHVPMNMKLLINLANFVIAGSSSNNTLPLLDISWLSDLVIINSVNVTIKNVIINNSITWNEYHGVCTYDVILKNCSFCTLIDVTIFQIGLTGNNLVGKTYLTNLVMDFGLCDVVNIVLYYGNNFKDQDHNENLIQIDNIFIKRDYKNCIDLGTLRVGTIIISLGSETFNNIKIFITNSNFWNICNTLLNMVVSHKCTLNNTVLIENSTFRNNVIFHTRSLVSMVSFVMPYCYMTITFSNCKFYNNVGTLLISVRVRIRDQCKTLNNTSTISSNISIINCSFDSNSCALMILYSTVPLPCVNIYIIGPIYIYGNGFVYHLYAHFEKLTVDITGPISVSRNSGADTIILVKSVDIVFNGPFIIRENVAEIIMMFKSSSILFSGPITISNNEASIMQMYSCNVTFNGSAAIDRNQRCDYIMQFYFSEVLYGKSIVIVSNFCKQMIALKSHRNTAYIKVLEYSNVTFAHNNYSNLIIVETGANYNNPYPLCLFQYVTLQNTSVTLPSHYTIIISDNFYYNCKLSTNYLTFYCKWIPTAVFNGQSSVDINRQIININQSHQRSISLCSEFNTYTLGSVYPGQKLLVELCMQCSDNYTVLYAETHSTLLPESACKIAHQSELINCIFNKSKVLSYTIVSERNGFCELFLTVSPFLYYIYEVFEVQLFQLDLLYTTEYVIVILFSQLILIRVTLINQLLDVLLTLG